MKDDKVTYRSAGVDIDAGELALKKIKSHVERTYNKNVLWGLGAFGGLFDLTEIAKTYKEPVLVQSIDGVGTKLMIATMANDHTTVGMDIVNHGCNDVLCQGARPLTFLDYVAMPRLSPEQMEQILSGMATACAQAGVAIIGGETAELPGIYREGEYDVAGVLTGVVEKKRIINGQSLKPGHVLVGLASNGLHTNGYTLARKVFFEINKIGIFDVPKGFTETAAKILLAPHVNYAPAVLDFLEKTQVHAIAHITGGGIAGNLVRVLPEGLKAVVKRGSWPVLDVFKYIQSSANIAQEEMERAFNMGLGLIIAVDKNDAESAVNFFNARGHASHIVGAMVEGSRSVTLV
ncbi:MAG: phosphoribosylformylglycinamidine cyclo-ligase [Nitrospinae bacterium]|nr:phosphoribosylformylglycinamidine cyclo-ligase [Nitrospinota bacterium]